MYRDQLSTGALPLPPGFGSPDNLAFSHPTRSNDSAYGELIDLAAPTSSSVPVVVEHHLPFRVGVVTSEAQLQRVQALRQMAYGRHLPEQAAAFGAPDPLDRLSDTTIFYVEDKITGAIVGSARVQSNRSRPLQIERSIELPAARRGMLLAEITRLCVMPGYDQPVRLALVKASHLFCIAMQIGGVLAGSRRSLLRTYENLGFADLFDDQRMCPLLHAGGLPHRILFRDTVTSEAMARERRHPDYDFVFRHYHPDINVFAALAASMSVGLTGIGESQGWQHAA